MPSKSAAAQLPAKGPARARKSSGVQGSAKTSSAQKGSPGKPAKPAKPAAELAAAGRARAVKPPRLPPKTGAKTTVKAAARAAALALAAPVAAPKRAARKATAAAVAAPAPALAARPVLVRDSFTMPEQEYAVLAEVKQACLRAGIEVKKSELLRIGVALLGQVDLATLKSVLAALPQLKTGRPPAS